jgi:cell division septation protein DedD
MKTPLISVSLYSIFSKFAAKLHQKIHFLDILSFFYLFISKNCRNFAVVIELDRHIEILLLSNDCVIVPRLGGFMAHAIEARYDDRDQLFLPPLRTLGFNPQLLINDSLLVQSYIEAYDISYPEALQRIEDEVEELKQHLQNEGTYELNDIGTLSLNDDGHYVFSPCESGILTPTLYGLSSVEMKRLAASRQPQADSETGNTSADARTVAIDSAKAEPAQTVAEAEQPLEETYKETYEEEEAEADVIHIKYTWVRNAVAVAAILLAVFILALPTGKTDMMTRTISNINNGLLFGMMSEDTNMSKIHISRNGHSISKSEEIISRSEERGARNESTQKADNAAKSMADSASTTNPNPQSTIPAPQKTFCIVLATQVSKRNADAFIERLQKQGLGQAEIFVRKNITRVIYGHYPSEEAAHDDLRRFHRNSETAEAWVMPL